jgi:hypothetical protein
MRFEAEIALASRELSRIRADIAHADVTALSALTPVQERAAAMRAASYVWLASTLERVVRDSIQATLREISASSQPLKQLRLSLFSLVCDSEFNSVADRARSNAWQAKIDLLERTVSAAFAELPEEILPLDGRTIRGEHLDTIWLVFGLPNTSPPSPLHRIALKDLADGRNQVAHGNADPVTFGRKKATLDMHRLVERVDDVIAHLLTTLDSYIDKRLYLRP